MDERTGGDDRREGDGARGPRAAAVKTLFVWCSLFLGSNYLVLQYYIDWQTVLPFTRTPADYILLIGIIVFIGAARQLDMKEIRSVYDRYRFPLIVLCVLIALSLSRSISEQSLGLTLLSHRGWFFLVFLLVGYHIVNTDFTLSKLVSVLSTFAVTAGVLALLYSFTFESGVLSRYFPLVIPFSGVFVLFHLIRMLRDHQKGQMGLLVFHLVVIVLSQTRSLWATCLVGLLVVGTLLRKRLRLRRFFAQFALVVILLVGILSLDVFDSVVSALESRLSVGMRDMQQETGSYGLRILLFLDAWDYINESGIDVVLFGISDLHWQSTKMLSLVGYGRIMGYAGIAYDYLGVEETAYMENAVASLLLTFGVVGSLSIWLLFYYPMVASTIATAIRIAHRDEIASAFLIAYGAFMFGQPIQFFFGVELKGMELGMLMFVAGAAARHELLGWKG